MKNEELDEIVYQIFVDGEDFCYEDYGGLWHIGVRDLFGDYKVIASNTKPSRFKNYELLTQEKIHKRKLNRKLSIPYHLITVPDGVKSFKEAADIVDFQAGFLRYMAKKGIEIIEPVKDGSIRLFVPIIPYDPDCFSQQRQPIIHELIANFWERLKRKLKNLFRP